MRALRRSAVRAAGVTSLQQQLRNTTILCVRKGNKVVMMGDSQVTLGDKYVAKSTTNKLRRAGENVLVGFAGSTADAMTLLEKLEGKLTEFPGQLLRSCVELAKEWRSDKFMRKLEASVIVASDSESLEIDGHGNVITPEEDGVLAVGSGGFFAKAAARALIDVEGLTAEDICKKSMKIAVSMDVFSNDNFHTDSLEKVEKPPKPEGEEDEKDGEGKEKEKKEKGPELKVTEKPKPPPSDAAPDAAPQEGSAPAAGGDAPGAAGGAATGAGSDAAPAAGSSSGGGAAPAAAQHAELQRRLAELQAQLDLLSAGGRVAASC
eukprot:TRINITY_DN2983_c1_g1_i1.p1 TRINITY_DN2983_c1_g1~~TRINITY_DN2983_c1_g1_i1.p1  ORF type:complete len:345 (+),score=158.90 TRINITY_DN2983_c1_g1_i1:76-1035(+)